MKIQLTHRSVPFVILGVLILTFGALLPVLGFYWDDWMHIYFFETRDLSELWDFSSYNRPLSTWLYYLTVPLLGSTPIKWQIFALVIRWLTAWSMWTVLCKIWPHRWREAAWMAVVFAVYPVFMQQAISVTFNQQYFAYLLFFISLWSMIKALQNRKRFWIFTSLSVVTQLLHMSLVEYFVFLELVRPVLLWLLCKKIEPEWKRLAARTAKVWIPYFLVLIGFVVWRLFIMELPGTDPNAVRIMGVLQENGLSGLLEYLEILLRNLLHVLATGWYEVLQPELIDFHSYSVLLAWFLAVVVCLGLCFVFRSSSVQPGVKVNAAWVKQAATVGMLAAAMGLVPGWIIGRDGLVGRYTDRINLPAMFGASIFIVAVIVGLISNQRVRTVFLAMLVGLSVAYHFRITNEYRWDWEHQRRAYWQMYWRMPALKDGASLLTEGAITKYANRYSSGLAVALLYNLPENSGDEYLFEYFYDGVYSKLDQLANGDLLIRGVRGQEFVFDLNKSIFLMGPSERGQCYWFLTPRDVHFTKLPQEIRNVIPHLDLDNILREPTSDNYPPANIFGPEEDRNWCYYFQKADLARQYEDWETVLELYRTTRENKFTTEHGYELLPFLEANLALENWDEAARLTRNTARLEGDPIRGVVCSMWTDHPPDDPEDQEFLEAQEILENHFICSTWEE
jgi:hypothetical protein